MNIICVTGSPGAGKTSYVNEHKGDNDIIFDWDAMFCAVTGKDSHGSATDGQKKVINYLRFALIRVCKDNSEDIDNLYVISTKPSDELKEMLGEECEYINLEVSEEEAKSRVDSDDTRTDKEAEHEKIDKYFNEERSMNILGKIENGRQYRNMQMNIRKNEEESGQDSFLVEGYATTYNEPYLLWADDDMEVREQVDANAFAECDMSDVIMQYDHQGRVFARISNNTLSLTSDEHGLLINADLGGTEIGRQLFEEIKGGYTSKMSFGFTVDDDAVEEFSEGSKRVYLRTITKIGKLYDVSAVSLPANDGTEISARSFVDGVIAKVEAERLLEAEEKRKAKAAALEVRIKKLALEMKINGN